MPRAVFFDRDGVLSRTLFTETGKPLAPWSLQDFVIESFSKKVVSKIREAGFLAIVVTNQPDVGHGKTTQSEVEQMHEVLRRELGVDDIEVCYATRADNSPRMKPAPGMLLDAAKKWGINLAESIMVGDRSGDIAAGAGAGCGMTILIDRNYPEPLLCEPTHRVTCLEEAMNIILGVVKTSQVS